MKKNKYDKAYLDALIKEATPVRRGVYADEYVRNVRGGSYEG